jgi:hypothetical protein
MEARLLRREHDRMFTYVSELKDADGVTFVCPKCFVENGSKRPGVHSITCWAPTVPQTTSPVPGRWDLVGTSLEDLTLVAGSSSVLVTEGCMAHFYIRNGEIVEGNW